MSGITLAEACVLVDYLQEKLGISPAAFAPVGTVAAAVVGVGDGGAASMAAEEKEFDVVIEDVPTSARIAVIEKVRAVTSVC